MKYIILSYVTTRNYSAEKFKCVYLLFYYETLTFWFLVQIINNTSTQKNSGLRRLCY